MDPIILGAGASFIAGAAGYVIFRYWVGPIRAYGRDKTALARELALLGELCPEKGRVDLNAKAVRPSSSRRAVTMPMFTSGDVTEV